MHQGDPTNVRETASTLLINSSARPTMRRISSTLSRCRTLRTRNWPTVWPTRAIQPPSYAQSWNNFDTLRKTSRGSISMSKPSAERFAHDIAQDEADRVYEQCL